MRHSDTYKKFFEAKFFLCKLEEVDKDEEDISKYLRDGYTPIYYYASAFLAAFRSITFIMQKEFHDSDGFGEWYKVKQEILTEDEKLKRIVEERDSTIHEKPVKTTPVIHIHQNSPDPNDFEIRDIHHSFDKDNPMESINDQFRYAIEKITPIVEECEAKFFKDDGHIGKLTISYL